MNVLSSIDLTHLPIVGENGERPVAAVIFHDDFNPVIRLYCTNDRDGALFDTRKAMLLSSNHSFSRESLRELAVHILKLRAEKQASQRGDLKEEVALMK